ncbi:hypothetical protein [Kribbella shirazensis]|uniref:Uncharacterized protein n=1 Tax=Kribbella shirazensis TaxID=1105143 RepID=A0A7X5VD98_9ACTN|nr:hypothetical protein [Kribbella shirazensis]NIK59115.1 hypothetical protein [Kribbella shirazensis]
MLIAVGAFLGPLIAAGIVVRLAASPLPILTVEDVGRATADSRHGHVGDSDAGWMCGVGGQGGADQCGEVGTCSRFGDAQQVVAAAALAAQAMADREDEAEDPSGCDGARVLEGQLLGELPQAGLGCHHVERIEMGHHLNYERRCAADA